MRRRPATRSTATEPLDAQPDDLLLAAHSPMVGRESARPLADGQVIGDHPGEVAAAETRRPTCPSCGRTIQPPHLHRRRHVVDPQHARARHQGCGLGGERPVGPIGHGRRRRCRLDGGQEAEEALATGPDENPGAPCPGGGLDELPTWRNSERKTGPGPANPKSTLAAKSLTKKGNGRGLPGRPS